MAKGPLFSTFRQGENRVTATLLAVWERIDLAWVARLLAAASGEDDLRLVQFQNQVVGAHSVPDAAIGASFRFLFEVKTERDAVRAAQLRGHLAALRGEQREERLFLLTPDPEPPALVATIDDRRLVWFNFAALAQAIDELLADAAAAVSDREAFLLRELRQLFEADGLLSPSHDVVVVAARVAYADYQRDAVYVCQPGRHFRAGVTRVAFYTAKAIQPAFPQIRRRWAEIAFDAPTAAGLGASADADDRRLGALIADWLARARVEAGEQLQVFLLSGPDDPDTLILPAPIAHAGPGAWTQGQRYLRSAALDPSPATTDQLAEAESLGASLVAR